jgi:hypothetical protein
LVYDAAGGLKINKVNDDDATPGSIYYSTIFNTLVYKTNDGRFLKFKFES